MKRLRPFGVVDDWPHDDLNDLIARLEGLISNEEERGDIGACQSTPRGRRLNKVYDAVALLEEASNA